MRFDNKNQPLPMMKVLVECWTDDPLTVNDEGRITLHNNDPRFGTFCFSAAAEEVRPFTERDTKEIM